MGLDGARSATRRELEGGTCATRVTRGTFDFQARDNFELRAGNFTRNFKVFSGAERSKQAFQSPFRRGVLKVAFKQKLVPRVTRVAHVTRRS